MGGGYPFSLKILLVTLACCDLQEFDQYHLESLYLVSARFFLIRSPTLNSDESNVNCWWNCHIKLIRGPPLASEWIKNNKDLMELLGACGQIRSIAVRQKKMFCFGRHLNIFKGW